MANPHRGEVALPVGERRYVLRFTNNALADLEEALGVPITVLTKRWERQEIGIRDIRAMLWAAALDRHPKLTLRDAGAIIDEAGAEAVSVKLLEAIQQAFPSTENGAGNAEAAAGSGPAS